MTQVIKAPFGQHLCEKCKEKKEKKVSSIYWQTPTGKIFLCAPHAIEVHRYGGRHDSRP